MKRHLRVASLVALGLALVAATGFAQLGVKKNWTLTFSVNVPGAQVYVDNTLVKGTSVVVPEAKHAVRVRADGYIDSNQVVDVKGNMTIEVTLQPILFPVQLKVTPADAYVYFDGDDVTGTPIRAPKGTHSLQVSARGYQDYFADVDVSGPGPLALEVVLEPAGYLVTVNANAPGATVLVNNVPEGPVPWSGYLPPGPYTVVVSADGYYDYITRVVVVNRPVTVNLTMKTMPAPKPGSAAAASYLTIELPADMIDPDVKPNDAAGQVKVYIDGKLANPNKVLEKISITAGRHKIRIASGAFSIELGEVTIRAGMRYIVTLDLVSTIRAVKATP